MQILKTSIIAIVIICVVGIMCASPESKARSMAGGSVYVETVTHEGCEYVLATYELNGVAIIHKENCSNPIHK